MAVLYLTNRWLMERPRWRNVSAGIFLVLYSVIGWPSMKDAVEAGQSRGHWVSGTPAPTKRTEVAVAELSGKIYVVGGFEEPSVANVIRYAVSRTVEVYDPKTDTWSTTTPLPEGRHHAGIAALGSHLYVVGGFTNSLISVWNPVGTVYRYDPGTKIWTELSAMPTPRGGLGVAVHQERLYAIGGYDGEKNPEVVEVFDPQTLAWTSAAPLPTPRDHLAVAVVDSRIYAIGGRPRLDYRHNLAVVEEYDPDTNRWRSRAPMPTPRSGIAAGVLDRRIYVIGGEAEIGTFSTNEAYDPQENRWHFMAPMPTARHGLGAAVVGGRMYVLSGGPSPGGSFSNANEIFVPPGFLRPTAIHRTPPEHIGAVMAILATLDEAGVLPPESSAEANQLIHALIQLQSAFLKSTSPAVREFFSKALRAYFFDRAPTVEQEFFREGWTSQILEAILLYKAYPQAWDNPDLNAALAEFNITRQDLRAVQVTYDQARQHFLRNSRDLHEVFRRVRQDMPGGQRGAR